MKEIYIKRGVGAHTTPSKLIKIGADIIVKPSTHTMNCCLRRWIIPDNARINSVDPLNKGKPDKYDILNHRPASILNGFSKVYENIIKTQCLTMINISLLFLSV